MGPEPDLKHIKRGRRGPVVIKNSFHNSGFIRGKSSAAALKQVASCLVLYRVHLEHLEEMD